MFLYQYTIHQPASGDPAATGKVIGHVIQRLGQTVVTDGDRYTAQTLGARQCGDRRWIGYAVLEPLGGDSEQDYTIDDSYGEPRKWVLSEWLEAVAGTVTSHRLEHA